MGFPPPTPSATTLPGKIEAYAGTTAPTGYLICDGTAVSRTVYAALFVVTSTTYGVGDGSTTFNIPDLRGRVPVGVGTNASVSSLALNDGVAVANRRPHHKHTPHAHTTGSGGTSAGSATAKVLAWGTNNTDYLISTSSVDGGSGVATDSLDAPAWITVNWIISF